LVAPGGRAHLRGLAIQPTTLDSIAGCQFMPKRSAAAIAKHPMEMYVYPPRTTARAGRAGSVGA